jgi:catechol 2,3-dioxygenase-like lactoylglutathione lyase family enzyme
MQLDHANIVTPHLAQAVTFFTDILGLTLGPRPNFAVPGAWLYSEARPLIHLSQATGGQPAARLASRIDHVALRLASLDEWNALIERLNARGIDYQLNAGAHVPDLQLWVEPVPGVTVEMTVAR